MSSGEKPCLPHSSPGSLKSMQMAIRQKRLAVLEAKAVLWGHTALAEKSWGLAWLELPVVEIQRFHCSGLGSIPDWGTKILHAVWHGQKKNAPRWCGGKEFACQRRRHRRLGFDPWLRKIPRRRAWQPFPVFLPGKSHGQKSLVGYYP